MNEKERYLENLKKRHGTTVKGFGRELSASGWAKLLGLGRTTVWRYIKKGLTIEEIADVRGIKIE